MPVTFKKKTKGTPFSIRFTPRIKFALELLGRRQRRTHAIIIERALEREAEECLTLSEEESGGIDGHPRNMLDFLWDPEEADRFVKLAQHFPKLLTYQEEHQWKMIRESKKYWKNRQPVIEAIRQDFGEIKEAAAQKVEG